MTRSLRRFAVVLFAAVVLLGVFANCAFATLEDAPTPTLGTTKTNPDTGADAWWREGWGNTLSPEFTLNPPGAWDSKVDGYLLGMAYSVNRFSSTIDTATPEKYYNAAWPVAESGATGGTNLDHTLDMVGICQDPFITGWPALQPGAHTPYEGQWAMDYVFYSSGTPPLPGSPPGTPWTGRYSNKQWTLGYGIDQTPPRAVTGLTIATALNRAAETTWTAAKRAYVTWDPSLNYDDLSGIGYYQVLVDDKPLIPETSSTPTQGRVYSAPWLPTPSAITVENMAPGAHKVSIVTVDRATNVGPPTSQWFYSDPDTPTISFTSPITNILSAKTIFSVNASDLAGPPTVVFQLDAAVLATVTAAPYSFKPDLGRLGTGTHTLKATVIDHLGRSVTVLKSVSFNNTFTSTGFMTAGPSEFSYVVPVSSTSNPPADRWRWDALDHTKVWTNSLHPDFGLERGAELATLESDSDGSVAGMLYDLRRSPELIDALSPANYFRSVRPLGASWSTHMDATLDLASVMAYPPAGGWPAPEPGAEFDIEGTWYLQYKGFLDTGWAESDTNVVKFGVDVTAPTMVEGLAASPTTDTAMAGAVSAGTRTHLSWFTKDYDALSGVAYYQVLLDGAPAMGATLDSQGRVFDIAGRIEPAVTVEDLTPGAHTFGVYAVDRAGNAGKTATTVVYSDPDVPTISFTSPTGSYVGVSARISANAADVGGVKNVTFKFDGADIAPPVTAAPYSVQANLGAYAAGLHTLSAVVTDRYGRQVTVSKSVTLDRTPLVLSGFSRTPELFYPIKRDKYKDNSTIYVSVNKSASLTLKVMNSAGTTLRSYQKTVNAGRTSFVWNGTWSSDNKAHTGTFYYQVVATDSAGNVASTGKLSTRIRNYELVKVSKNKVKVIAR